MLLFPFRKIHPHRPHISNSHKFIMGNQMWRQDWTPSLGCIYRDPVWKPKQKFYCGSRESKHTVQSLLGTCGSQTVSAWNYRKCLLRGKQAWWQRRYVLSASACLFNKQYMWSRHLNRRGRKIRASRSRAYIFLLYHYKPVVYRGLGFLSYQI